MDSNIIKDNYFRIKGLIAEALKRSSRHQKVSLIAVSKKQSVDKMNQYGEILGAEGVRPIFGENYIQEFFDKKDQLLNSFDSHFIGRLQSNKVKDAVKCFSVIESVHDRKLLQKINLAARDIDKIMPIMLQVNISRDPNKSGFLAEDVPVIVKGMTEFSHLNLIGLMTITELYESSEAARGDFRAMRVLGDSVFGADSNYALSMGMSQDFEVAIEEGATHIRIGTALFGART